MGRPVGLLSVGEKLVALRLSDDERLPLVATTYVVRIATNSGFPIVILAKSLIKFFRDFGVTISWAICVCVIF